MKVANWDRLRDNVLRPDIDKFLVPLMLYRGTRGFGWMHRCWNFALHCMESDVLSYGEAVRLSHNPDFVHLATGVKKVTHPHLSGIFGRLIDNPAVTDNIAGFTEYVREIEGTKYTLTRVPLYSTDLRAPPWRIKGRDPEANIGLLSAIPHTDNTRIEFPFMLHKGEAERALLSDIHCAIPANWPSALRADICQDLVTDIVSGGMPRDVLESPAAFLPMLARAHPFKYQGIGA